MVNVCPICKRPEPYLVKSFESQVHYKCKTCWTKFIYPASAPEATATQAVYSESRIISIIRKINWPEVIVATPVCVHRITNYTILHTQTFRSTDELITTLTQIESGLTLNNIVLAGLLEAVEDPVETLRLVASVPRSPLRIAFVCQNGSDIRARIIRKPLYYVHTNPTLVYSLPNLWLLFDLAGLKPVKISSFTCDGNPITTSVRFITTHVWLGEYLIAKAGPFVH